MQPTRELTPEAAFFFKHAGYSYAPTETAAQGRTRTAEQLAAAEDLFLAAVRVGDVRCDWGPDEEGYNEQRPRIGKECESCCIWQGSLVLADLHGIWDADANYRRVVRAELALECADALRAIVAGG